MKKPDEQDPTFDWESKIYQSIRNHTLTVRFPTHAQAIGNEEGNLAFLFRKSVENEMLSREVCVEEICGQLF